MKILYAGDDRDDIDFFKEVLEDIEQKTELTFAKNGIELMELLTKHSVPDILFLDINMPLKNGYQCVKEIRADERLKNLPVVVFATASSEAAITAMYSYGANLFIRKPPSFKKWKKAISKALTVDYSKYSQKPFEDFLLSEN